MKGLVAICLLLAGVASAVDIEERQLTGGEELVLTFPQQDIQARWTPLGSRADLPWAAWQGKGVSSVSGSMPLFALISQTDANRLTLACSELVRPIETICCLKYEKGSVMEVRVRAVEAPPDFTCTVRLDRRNLPFAETVGAACDWLRGFADNRSEASPESAYDPLWNSWYAYRTGITAEAMEREGEAARAYGIGTLVYDMGWDRAGSIDSTSFRPCGDWIASSATFPDFAGHLRRQHAKGLRCLLWFGYPLVGDQAANLARLTPFCLPGKPDKRGCLTLDPSRPEAAAFVGETAVRLLRDYGADGLKIDFLQSFAAGGAKPVDVARFQAALAGRIAAVKPDALIEYMSLYSGLAQHRFCTHVRATDCPGDAVYNRWQTVNLRLTSGRRAIHSDMVTWDDSETAETAALQIIAVLHSVVQYGRSLVSLTPDHARMLKHWTRFAAEHRQTLLKGAFRPHGCVQGYPLIEMESDAERIFTVHAPSQIVDVGAGDRPVIVVNGSGAKGLVLRLPANARAEIRTACGEVVETREVRAGLADLPVPAAGLIRLIWPDLPPTP